MNTEYKCPKCGGELSDLWDGEPVSAFVGEWSDDRFRCEGKWIAAQDDRFGEYGEIQWFNRTKSCGYFGLENLGDFL
ncbi:hypothetical protein [Pasteurella sp. PK-2025]|uniref:hypothetical protein n=1 Tax=Pasteurella sp. PK-2025 TaxID=3413133 RepID=UPI003C75BE40